MSTNENKVNKKKRYDKIETTMWLIIGFLIFLILNVCFTIFGNDDNIVPSFIFSTLQLITFILIPPIIFPNSKPFRILMGFIYIIFAVVLAILLSSKIMVISTLGAFIFLIATVYVTEAVSTIVTLLFLIPIPIVICVVFKMYSKTSMYITFTVAIVLYIIGGVKINQFFLKNVIPTNKDEYSDFNREKFNNLINLIYFIAFVLLNASGIIRKEYGDVVNNIFLTGLCLIAVDWKEILKRFQFISSNTNQEQSSIDNQIRE